MRSFHPDISTKRKFAWLTFSSILILSFFREPKFFLSPRIWAEEGSVYLQAVLNNGPWDSITTPHLGYYSLVSNVSASIGLVSLGLNGVAYLTTYLSFALMLMAVSAPLILKSAYWDTDEKKILLVLFSLISSSGEIWLNTICSQFYLSLFCAYILLSDRCSLSKWRAAYIKAMSVISVLTGGAAVVLAPFFFFNAFRNRGSTTDRHIAWIYAAGLCIQCTAFLNASARGSPTRLSAENLSHLPEGLLNTCLALADNLPLEGKVGVLVLFSGMALYERANAARRYLLVIAIYLGFVFSALSLGMAGGPRYGYASGVLLFLFLLNLAFDKSSKTHVPAMLASTIIFVSCGLAFPRISHYYETHWYEFSTRSIFKTPTGERYIKAFPQWEGTNWIVLVDDQALMRYQ